MTLLFIFAVVLLIAVLISDLADRSVLSTAVLFLMAGVLVGEGIFGAVSIQPDSEAVSILAELALFSVLFSDGMKVGFKDLAKAWKLPGRALFFGLPLTLVGTAMLAHWIVGLPWPESFLIGAVLSPTDPVFASAIVGREEVPSRLRQLLNVESGLNDGLALPIVLAMLALVASESFDLGEIALEVAMGIGIGILIPWASIRLEQSRFFSAHACYQPLNAFAIGLLVFTISSMTQANEFLAAFAAGITVATIGPEVREAFHRFGELVAELLKLAALLVFGALISPKFLGEISASGYIFALLVLVAVRPLALSISLLWSPLGWRERATAAWFGPKGFASVVFGLLILKQAKVSKIDWGRADQLFHLIALCITGSIIAHSSTDVLVARWLGRDRGKPETFSESAEESPSPG
ncbi:cation:proton antiporter [Tundrisphaera lichenicola]|uniref:cation:proton antiporter n=1 Tax=Tundrisphaera lichenicola TaxID=2029860 RepID=UPI003EBCB284